MKTLVPSYLIQMLYKIDCRDCEALYVGQIDRCLKTRINEHHINWNTTQHPVSTQNTELIISMILIGKMSILDEERVLNKRLISEMIHLKQQKQSLNLQNDTYSLNPLYMNLFTELWRCFPSLFLFFIFISITT